MKPPWRTHNHIAVSTKSLHVSIFSCTEVYVGYHHIIVFEQGFFIYCKLSIQGIRKDLGFFHTSPNPESRADLCECKTYKLNCDPRLHSRTRTPKSLTLQFFCVFTIPELPEKNLFCSPWLRSFPVVMITPLAQKCPLFCVLWWQLRVNNVLPLYRNLLSTDDKSTEEIHLAPWSKAFTLFQHLNILRECNSACAHALATCITIPVFIVGNSCLSVEEDQIKMGFDTRIWWSYCSTKVQSLVSTRREEPRQSEMERKV